MHCVVTSVPAGHPGEVLKNTNIVFAAFTSELEFSLSQWKVHTSQNNGLRRLYPFCDYIILFNLDCRSILVLFRK